ncbi:MAG: hypothetical protein WD852_05390 [Methyloceanibacter sp.]
MLSYGIRALALGALFLPTVSLAGGPFGSFSVGDWSVSAYSSDTTGRFSHCAGGGVYKSGIVFIVSVDSNYNWYLGFIHDSWRLKKGDTFPINLSFDSRHQFRVQGTALDEKLVKVPMPGNSALIRQFRWARGMTAYAKGYLYAFNLTNTSRLLPALVGCVNANEGKYETALRLLPSNNNTDASPPKPSPELQMEAIALTTNFMLGAQLQNPRILSLAETPPALANVGAAWKSDEASGVVMIVESSAGLKGLEVAAAVANGQSENCKGKFASGRVSELVDSEVVFRGFSSCEDSNGHVTSQFFVVPRRQGGFVVFSVYGREFTVTHDSPQSDDRSQSDELAGYQRAALTAVER